MKNKTGFFGQLSLIEILIITAILSVLVVTFIGTSRLHMVGKKYIVKSSGVQVEVIKESTSWKMVVCRIDNGPGIVPRYQQVEFRINELEPVVEK